MRAQYRIRRALPGDLVRIQEIEKASFGREAYDCKLFAYYLNRCGKLFLVAERRRQICAYMITCLRALRAELISVAVDPAQRKAGAGSALLESTLRRLRRQKIARWHLMVRVNNRAALRFYEKYGFQRIRRVPGYYEDGAAGMIMALRIGPQ
jgi:[ribosomal protein S18]-alanine N-acetyltransferase